MSLTFGEAFDEVCEKRYGIRVNEVTQYLAGEYTANKPVAKKPTYMVEVIWTHQRESRIAALARKLILPESLQLYTAENEVDLRLIQGRVIGDIALTSSTLTDKGMLSIIEARMPLHPFKPETPPWE